MARTDGPGLAPELRAAVDLLLVRPPQVEIALARLTARCLAETGVLDGTGMSRSDVEQALLGDRLARPEWTRATLSGVVPPLTVEEARTLGYRGVVASHHQRDPAAGLPDHVQQALDPRAGPVEHADVPGVFRVSEPGTGCRARARVRLFGSVRGWLLVDHLVPSGLRRFGGRATRAPEVVAAAADYAARMARRGYDAATPAHAARRARLSWLEGEASALPGPEELAMAEADALSQQESHVHAVLEEAVLGLAGPWLEEHAEHVLGAAALLTTATGRAAELLRG